MKVFTPLLLAFLILTPACTTNKTIVIQQTILSTTTTVTHTATTTETITISSSAPLSNTPPTARFNVEKVNAPSYARYKFIDSSTDSDGSISSWDWNFGDGSIGSTEQNPIHDFPGIGVYLIVLTVTDDSGASDQCSNQLQVESVIG